VTLARYLQTCPGMTTATATKKPTRQEALNEEAMALFDVQSEKSIQTVLYALGFRQPCGRCGGTGRYSYNQMDGDRCYGCNGKKNVAVKLTRKVLDEARVKVDAGELVRIREVGAARIAAKKSIAGLIEAARAVYTTIGEAYTRLGRLEPNAAIFVKSAVFYAQTMNSSLFFDCIRDIDRDVNFGNRKDYERCVAEIIEATDLLVQLRDHWIAYEGIEPCRE
jgi:hypothetical protein